MKRLFVCLCLVAAVLATPLVSRSRTQIEEFRKFLESTRNEKVIVKNSEEDHWITSGKFEGDIVLDDFLVDRLVEGYSGNRNAYLLPGTKWPDNTVIYEFVPGEFNDEQVAAIHRGMQEIEDRTCIRFRERQGESAYVRLTGGPGGCYANVGYWQSRGPHVYNLARNAVGVGCFRHTTVIHEYLHILGFFHMQSTHNRDDYVQVMWDNIQSGTEHNFDMYPQGTVSNLDLPYEFTSSMHYPSHGFSVNGFPTLVPRVPFEGVMGQDQYVTDLDYLRVNRHYNCPGAWD